MPERPRLLLFDPYSAGHHGEYIRYLLRAWPGAAGQLHVSVSATLLEKHPDLVELAAASAGSITLETLADGPEVERLVAVSLVQAGRLQGRLFASVLERHRPHHALAMYVDHLLPSLALRLRVPRDVRVSGILFRPSFHYASTPSGWGERLRDLRKRLMLRAALQHPRLDRLFSLDPTAVEPLQRLRGAVHVTALPDPVPARRSALTRPALTRPAQAERSIHARFGLPADRTLLLLFGVLNERKGIAEVFAALDRLSEDNARRFALLLAGPVAESLRGNMSGWIARARARGVAVALHDAFVQEEEIQALLEASDALLLCYQRHIGSSAVLIRAAGAGLPVVGQAYGLMGDHIARHRLGCPVDSDDPASIAAALAVLARDPALTDHFDKRLARQFAEANTVEAYTTTLLRAFAPSTLPH